MKTTKDEIDLLRHHANVVANRDQGALILSVLDDLGEVEARAERYRVALERIVKRAWGARDADEAIEFAQEMAAHLSRAENMARAALAETANETSEWRTCEYCGCRTNARLRQCCDRGHAADGEVALAETTNKTSETEPTGMDRDERPGATKVGPVDRVTSTPAGGSEGAGTSSPDDAERAAREWLGLDRWYGAGRLTVAHVKTLAALLVQAREAGRVEERADMVAFCRLCAANNGAAVGWMVARTAKDLAALDARRFAFLADQFERGEHIKRHDRAK